MTFVESAISSDRLKEGKNIDHIKRRSIALTVSLRWKVTADRDHAASIKIATVETREVSIDKEAHDIKMIRIVKKLRSRRDDRHRDTIGSNAKSITKLHNRRNIEAKSTSEASRHNIQSMIADHSCATNIV